MGDLIKAGCVALVLSLSLAAPVAAGQPEDGLAADERGDYATALRLWRPLAAQGHAASLYNFGLMYDTGQGVSQDDAKAVTWLRKAAEQSHASAQFNLGVMYERGQGVPQDSAEAVKWFRKAAEQGDASAQSNLGLMYDAGRGVPQDYVRACMWFLLAAARFPASETARREKAVEGRDLVAEKMTAAQIAEALRLARDWKPK